MNMKIDGIAIDLDKLINAMTGPDSEQFPSVWVYKTESDGTLPGGIVTTGAQEIPGDIGCRNSQVVVAYLKADGPLDNDDEIVGDDIERWTNEIARQWHESEAERCV